MSERDDLVLQQLIVACWELFLLALHKSAICTRVEVGEDYSQKGHLTAWRHEFLNWIEEDTDRERQERSGGSENSGDRA